MNAEPTDPAQQIEALKRKNRQLTRCVWALVACVMLLIVLNVGVQSVHHGETHYFENDQVNVDIDGNTVLCALGIPFKQTLSVVRGYPDFRGEQGKTVMLTHVSTFPGPAFTGPFLKQVEGAPAYVAANSPLRLERDAGGVWKVGK